jgi:hypothetical protein
LGTKYLVVLCAGSALQLARQSLDEAPYKLSLSCHKLASITFSHLSAPLLIDIPWFHTEGKSCCYIHHTFLLGFPTDWSFTRHQAYFLAPLPGRKKKTSARGVFRTHILYFVLSFALLYLFYLHDFIKNPKKIESFVVVISLL